MEHHAPMPPVGESQIEMFSSAQFAAPDGWPSNEDLVGTIRSVRVGSDWLSFVIALHRAVLASTLVIEPGGRGAVPEPGSPLAGGDLPKGVYLPAFTSDKALHDCQPPSPGHHHLAGAAPDVFAYALEIGMQGVVIDHDSRHDTYFTSWPSAWFAASLMPRHAKPADEAMPEIAMRLRPILQSYDLESAHLAWAHDANEHKQLALAVSPAGRWPRSRREALADDVRTFSEHVIDGAVPRLVALAEPPEPDWDMLRVI